jgi:DNA-binding FrmR family transcriptional regulator
MTQPDFAPIIARLRRAEGHLAALLTMVAEGRSCLELAQQLHAIERAIASTKRELIHTHIDRCLTSAATTPLQAKSVLSEIRSLGKYL